MRPFGRFSLLTFVVPVVCMEDLELKDIDASFAQGFAALFFETRSRDRA